MFTGIVQGRAEVRDVATTDAGRRLTLSVAPLAAPPDRGASVCVQGVCLTVSDLPEPQTMAFDVIPETLTRTTLGGLEPGARVNVEPSLRVGDELGGHWVSGHVDGVAEVTAVDRSDGVVVRFGVPAELSRFIASKGSIALDGISLTVVEVGDATCAVALIPETLERTSAGAWAAGTRVNCEVDLVARYVARLADRS